jgi:hypothetical protein
MFTQRLAHRLPVRRRPQVAVGSYFVQPIDVDTVPGGSVITLGTAVDPSRTFILNSSQKKWTIGPSPNADVQHVRDMSGYLELQSGTDLNVFTNAACVVQRMIAYAVSSSPSNADGFQVRDRRVLVLTDTNAINYTPNSISAVSDRNQCWVNITGVSTGRGGTAQGQMLGVYGRLLANGQVEIRGNSNAVTNNTVICVEVVEFGSAWDLYYGFLQSASGNGAIPLTQDSTGVGTNTNPANFANAFIDANLWKGAATTNDHDGISSIGLTYVPGAFGGIDFSAQTGYASIAEETKFTTVMSHPRLFVERELTPQIALPFTRNFTISDRPLGARAAIVCATTTGTGTAYARAAYGIRLLSSTTAQAAVSRDDNSGRIGIQVIDFGGI